MTRHLFTLIILSVIVISCDNKADIDKTKPSYLDSLVNFEEIQEIYLYVKPPIDYNETPLSDSIAIIKEDLIEDSVTLKWANSKSVIRQFSYAFPKFTYAANLNWDTTAKSYNELLIVTKDTVHTVGWFLSNKDSLFGYDSEVFKVNKTELANALKILDRKIITKEIYKIDFYKYNLNNKYNLTYLGRCDSFRPRQDKMFIYLLK